MPPNVLAFRVPITSRHSSRTRAQLSLSHIPSGSGAASTRNRHNAGFTGTEIPDFAYGFSGPSASSRPPHDSLFTWSRNDGDASGPAAPLAGPPLDALGGPHVAGIRIRRPAVAGAAPARAAAGFRGIDPAVGASVLTACLLTTLFAASYALAVHPMLREIAAGSVLAIWPAWVALGVVFGVAAWAGRA